MEHAKKLANSFNRPTTASVASAAVLTWFFSAMQCNKGSCYTTDNPIVQVAFAGILAAAAIMTATSAPVLKAIEPLTTPLSKKINQLKTYLDEAPTSQETKKPEEKETKATKTDTAENLDAEIVATPTPRSGSGLFSPSNDSLRANASETPHFPTPTQSPLATSLQL